MLRYGMLVGCVVVCAGCSNLAPSENRAADVQALKDTEAACMNEARAKNLDKWVACYADDAAVLVPNAPTITGHDNIRAALQPFMADPNFALSLSATKAEVAGTGDLGYTRGTYSMTMSDPKTRQPVVDRGKYVTVFRKQGGGKWKAVEDMFSSDMPAPADSH